MKKILLIITMFLAVSGANFRAEAQRNFTITWKFLNIVSGYDHQNKMQVYIDGDLKGTSTETLETAGNSYKTTVTSGSHDYKLMNVALYDGKWEDHTIDNGYSIDCMDEGNHSFVKNQKIYLVFDIDNGTTVSWGKWSKEQKQAMKAAKKKAKAAKKNG